MKRFQKTLAATLFLAAMAGSLAAQDKSSVGKSEYFPLAVNTRWDYVTAKGVKIVTQVTKHEEIAGAMCARVEATLGGTKKSNEYIRVEKDGVYRYQASDQVIDPPLRFLMLPFKEEDTWMVESKALGLTVKGTFKITKGSVKVQGKEYTDVLICKSTDFMIADKKAEHTYWFAKGIGMVKQVVTFGGHQMSLELERYTPGGN